MSSNRLYTEQEVLDRIKAVRLHVTSVGILPLILQGGLWQEERGNAKTMVDSPNLSDDPLARAIYGHVDAELRNCGMGIPDSEERDFWLWQHEKDAQIRGAALASAGWIDGRGPADGDVTKFLRK